jgi:hypothetical protein
VPAEDSESDNPDRFEADSGDQTARQLPAHRPPADRTPAEVEAAFASIVASFHNDPTAEPTWPAVENLPGRDAVSAPSADPSPSEPDAGTGVVRWRGSTVDPYNDDDGTLLDALDTFGADLPDEDEGSYIPPPPPPLPHFSINAIVGTLALVVGLVIILAPQLLPISDGAARFLGFAAMVTGAGMLIWRLRPGGDEEGEEPDDGAVV